MENTGQGKSQLSDPKLKKEIISKCESKIRHLYKRRMTGLGAFIPDPIRSSSEIVYASPLIVMGSHFTYNCEEEISEWRCPGIVVPPVKIKQKNDCGKPSSSSNVPQRRPDSDPRYGLENPNIIPTLTNNQMLQQNWNSTIPPQQSFMNPYDNNQQNLFPSYQSHQNWTNPPHRQNMYSVQPPPMQSHSEIPTLGTTGYFHPPSAREFMPSQQNYSPQQEMLNYPPRISYPTVQPHLSKSLNHPGMYSNSLQTDPLIQNYQYNVEESQKLKKNKIMNNLNPNLISLLNNPAAQGMTTNKVDNLGVSIDLTTENDFPRDKAGSSDNKLLKEIPTSNQPIAANNAKDKLLRKLWQLRKSSDYIHVPIEQQCTREQNDDEFYKKLNYAEMQEDTQLDSIHDYQLINLRERIETCLEGKVSPDHSRRRSRDRRDGDRLRDRDRGRDRERDRGRDRDRDRKRHGRSPLPDDRKKYRAGDDDRDRARRRSRESPISRREVSMKSKEDVIEILSDDDKQKTSDSFSSEGLTNQHEKTEPTDKSIPNQIFELLGPEIRKTQEKSDLYKSIISSLDMGDRTYKRLYSFKNTALTKAEKDNKLKMVVPRDNLKEVITAVHKNFHYIQNEELSRLLKEMIYPTMLHIPKCISKVVSECPTCIEEKRKEEKKEDVLKDKKNEKGERKPDKRFDKSFRDKDRRNSHDRDKRISRETGSLSKARRDPLRSGRERDAKDPSDGRPSGYEKATKVKKAPSTSEKSNKSSSKSPEEIINDQSEEDKSSEVLHELSDKALEFKNLTEPVIAMDAANQPTNTEETYLVTDSSEYADNAASSIEINVGDNKNIKDKEQINEMEDIKNQDTETSIEVKDNVNNENTAVIVLDTSDSAVVNTMKDNQNPVSETLGVPTGNNENIDSRTSDSSVIKTTRDNFSNNSSDTVSEDNTKRSWNAISNKEVAETVKEEVKVKKDIPKLDFKGRVRQVQMSSSECKDIITALEPGGDRVVDPSYLLKGGMLCKKSTSGAGSEVKIVAPIDELEEVVNIVHTMSAVHTPASKVIIFFSKHFTQVNNLDSKVNEFVNKCSNCKIKGS